MLELNNDGDLADHTMEVSSEVPQDGECSSRVVMALSVADAQRSVGGVPEHYILKDFETWVGYFAPGKLLVKVLNVVSFGWTYHFRIFALSVVGLSLGIANTLKVLRDCRRFLRRKGVLLRDNPRII